MTGKAGIVGKISTLTNYDAELFFRRSGWEVAITFQPWRNNAGTIDVRELSAIIPRLDREAATKFIEAYPIGTILKWTAAEPIEMVGDRLLAEVFHVEGKAEDTEISAFRVAEEIFDPFIHNELGEFWKPGRFGAYKGRGSWLGLDISLLLDGCVSDLQSAGNHAMTLFTNDKLWQAEFDDRNFADLYPLWNEVWREDRPILERAEWLSRIKVSTLSIDADGCFNVYFDDGDLFWGHSIQLSGSLSDGAIASQIVG